MPLLRHNLHMIKNICFKHFLVILCKSVPSPNHCSDFVYIALVLEIHAVGHSICIFLHLAHFARIFFEIYPYHCWYCYSLSDDRHPMDKQKPIFLLNNI